MTNLIYFDKEAANEELVSHHRGELIERVERITQTQRVGGELGGELGFSVFEPLFAKLYAAISASYESGKEEEFVYSLGDDAAKFELLMEVLEDSGTPWLGRGLPVEERAGIRMDLPVIVNGPVICTPLGELRDHIDISSNTELAREGVQDLIDSGILDEGEQKQSLYLQEELKSIGGATGGLQKLLSSLSADNIHRVPLEDSQIDFVMELNEEWFHNPPRTFPSPNSSYVVVGTVMSKVSENEREELIDLFKFEDTESHNRNDRRIQARQSKSKLAGMADDILDRSVRPSEFDISYPDIQLNPLAIYAIN